MKDEIITKQMLNVQLNSVYIWPNGRSIDYAKILAQELGRDDLQIFPKGVLVTNWFRGKRISEIIVDHAVILTERERDGLMRVLVAAIKI